MQVIQPLQQGGISSGVTAFGIFMPSVTPLSIKLLVEHFIAEKPDNNTIASDTALDSLLTAGDVNAVLDAAAITPDRRGIFIKNVLQLIENDRLAPVARSVARLAWLLPVFLTDIKVDPTVSVSGRSVNLFEQLSALAAMFDNFDAQIRILELSNSLPDSARGFIAPINALGLCFALDHAIGASREALLDDVTPFKTFKALAEVAAARCDLKAVDEDDTLETLTERIASVDVLSKKFGVPARGTRMRPDRPTRNKKPPNSSEPGDDPI